VGTGAALQALDPGRARATRAGSHGCFSRSTRHANHDIRIDRRTLQAQGIDRAPGIHEGPRASHINDNVRRPQSKARTNGAGRVIDYPAIDRGQTRREFNAQIIDLNLERAVRAGNPETAAWAKFEKEQAGKDSALEKQLRAARRARTQQRRAASGEYTAAARKLRTEHRDKVRAAQTAVQADFAQRRAALAGQQDRQRQALRKKQKGLLARLTRRLSKAARAKQVAARARQIEQHREERRLSQIHARRLVDAYFSGKPPSDRNVKGMLRETARQATREIKHEHDRAEKDFAHNKRAELDDMLRGFARAREASPARRQDFARAGVKEKAKTNFEKAAKDDAIARAMDKVNRREAGNGNENEPDRDKGRDRDR